MAQSYVISPQGRLRLWIGVFFLGLPVLLVLSWLLYPEMREWNVAGVGRYLSLVLFAIVMVTATGVGIFFTCFRRRVTVEPAGGYVILHTGVFGVAVRRKVWPLSDFRYIELRHRCAADVSPRDAYQSDIGIRHTSGFVLWLKGFSSSTAEPSVEASAFIADLAVRTGLRYEQDMVSKTLQATAAAPRS